VGQMGQEKCTGEMKIHTKLKLDSLSGKSTLGDLGLYYMLHCNELDVKDYNSSFLPLSKTQILPLQYKFC
jgi:hypothetical protein